MDLGGVHLPLDDVEQGDVAVAMLPVPRSGHHHILGLHFIMKRNSFFNAQRQQISTVITKLR